MPGKFRIKVKVANVEQNIEIDADELPAEISIEISEITEVSVGKNKEEEDKPISFDVGIEPYNDDDDEDWDDDECDEDWDDDY